MMVETVMKSEKEATVNIIGAGLAGLSVALTLAKRKIPSRLLSVQQSERAQSNLAEGGINAALDVMGEADTVEEHFADTMNGGCDLAEPAMVRGLVEAAPEIVRELERLGVPFHRENGHIVQRNFGGQKKKRTAYAKSSTGKVLTVAMIDAVRKYEAEGLVERFAHHRFEGICIAKDREEVVSALDCGQDAPVGRGDNGSEWNRTNRICTGVQVFDEYTKQSMLFDGPVVMCCGGMNGMFYGNTTGTTANTGSAAALLFSQGVAFANLEFLQYHPTTVRISGKRLLISEAARGEGGRLFVFRGGKEQYFMEELYGERGNLMPRDVVSREMTKLDEQAYLDLRGLSEEVWTEKLSDLREEIEHYLGMDPAKEPVPVSPGIHYFMGGIRVDAAHRTNVAGLYAAGECACAYHGANRLGGNSLLGAVYGGRVAATTAARELQKWRESAALQGVFGAVSLYSAVERKSADGACGGMEVQAEAAMESEMEQALLSGLSVLRTAEGLEAALSVIRQLGDASSENMSEEMTARLRLAEAFCQSALARKESRGAHTRLDFPDTAEAFHRTTVARFDGETIQISFAKIPQTASLETDGA